MGHLITLGNKSQKVVFTDTFTRTDNATSMGSAEIGGAWSPQGGAVFGVIGGEGYCAGDTDGSIVVANTTRTMTKFTITYTTKGCVSTGTNSRRLNGMFKYISVSNFWYVSMVGGNITLGKCDTSTFTTMATTPMTTTNDVYYKIKIVVNGASIIVFVDDILRINYTMTAAEFSKFGTQGGIGFRLNNTGAPTTVARVDNYTLTTT